MATSQSPRRKAKGDETVDEATVARTQLSRVGRISLLPPGESEAICQRIDLDGATNDEITVLTTNLRSIMSKAADRASKKTGNTYRTETGSLLTTSNDIIVFAVVTRTN